MKKYTIEHGKDGPRREKWVVVMEDLDKQHMEIVCVCYQEHYAQRIHELYSGETMTDREQNLTEKT